MERLWWVSVCVGVVVLSLVAGCPSDCVCKWKGGKQTVECVNRALRTFPPTIDQGTQVLDMSGNSFETLPPDHFMRQGLINLQKIHLAKCRLSHINSRAFRGLSNLVELDLSGNTLREVPTASFIDCQGLMRLVLSGNPIPHLQKRAFAALQSLTTLELAHAGLELVEYGAFEGLHSLEWLRLEGNRLRRISGLGALPLGLKGVWLEENPWECDCQLLELRLWLGDRNVANSVEPRCLGPERVANLTMRTLPPEDFACLPQLSPTTMYQKIGEGRNVSLLCKVASVPEATVEWLFNSRPLSNASLNLLVDTYPTGSHPQGSHPSSTTSIEKKSELLILNATSEENGTFLCVATNPAGTAIANFTLRVLTRDDPLTTDYSSLGSLSNIPFVSSHPNLFIILLSTVAVIGLVVIVLLLSLILCKCCRVCRRGQRGQGKGQSDSGGDKRQLSRSESTLTTLKSKSNGSVFLLTSSQEGLGDSNPDLIEGVSKRVEGDGHEHSQSLYSPSGDHLVPSSGSGLYTTLSRVPNHPIATSPSTSGPLILEPGQFNLQPWPGDYGLPKGMPMVRSQQNYTSISPSPIPSNYDLAKYPKEYLNPQMGQCGYGQLVYQGDPGDYYSTYILPPGTYLTYSNEFPTQPAPNCCCAPIPEGNEELTCATATTISKATSPILQKKSESPSLNATNTTATSSQTSSPVKINGSQKVGGSSSKVGGSQICRLKRQLQTTQESPDEGYEDEGAEGTEI